MAALAVQTITQAGVTPTYAAATGGGDTAPVGDAYVLIVKNGGGSPINVTLDVKPDLTVTGGSYPDNVVAVPNGGEKWIGPLRADYYRNPTTGVCNITYSAVTSVTVGVVGL